MVWYNCRGAEKVNTTTEASDCISNCGGALGKATYPVLVSERTSQMAHLELSHKGLGFLYVWGCEKHARQKGHFVERQRDEENHTAPK